MKKKITLLFLLSMILAFAASPACAAPEGLWTDDGTVATGFARGSGSEADPYIITNGAQFAYLAQTVNSGDTYLGKFFQQSGDIDLSAHYWKPIGMAFDSVKAFSGTFDGGNYKISGMTIKNVQNSAYHALFGIIHNGNLKNIHITGASLDVTGSISTTAGLASSFTVSEDVSSSVTNCTFQGDMSGSYGASGLLAGINVYENGALRVANCGVRGTVTSTHGSGGGLIGGVNLISAKGEASFTVTNCSVDVQVSALENMGGIVTGINADAGMVSITHCTVNGKLIGLGDKSNEVGGIVGDLRADDVYGTDYSSRAEIFNCRVYADVLGYKNSYTSITYTGGIVGQMRVYYSKGYIENCAVFGKVTGDSYLGGIAGYVSVLNGGNEDLAAYIRRSFSTGDIEGRSTVGGIAGFSSGRALISNCYSSGNIAGSSWTGGIAGEFRLQSGATLGNCYASGQITGSSQTGGIVGRLDFDKGTVARCIVLSDAINGEGANTGRVIGFQNYPISDDMFVGYNYANAAMLVNGETVSGSTHRDKNGEGVALATMRMQSWWAETATFSFGNSDAAPWVWDDTAKRPVLYFADLSGEPVGEGISTELPAGVPSNVSAVAADDLKTGSDSFASEDAVVDKISAQTEFGETSFGSDGTIRHSALAAVNGWGNVGAGEFTALPVFEAKTNAAGQVAAVSFKVVGAQLFASTAGRVKIMKVLSQSAYEAYTFIADAGGIADKTFAIQLDGDPAFLASNAPISGVGDYRVVLFIKDGGTYDLDGAENGRVLDPTVILDPQAEIGGVDPSDPDDDPDGGGSSNGCNALGFGLIALALLPNLYRRKR